MNGGSGSPLQARLEVDVFAVASIIIAIFAAIAVIFLLSKAIQKYLNSPAYLEKKKNRPTSPKDLNEMCNTCNLIKEERDVLASIVKNHKTPNIKYAVKDYTFMCSLFKEQFKAYDQVKDEIGKSNLFSTQKKVFKVFRPKVLVKKSKNIALNTVFTYTVSKGFHHKFILIANDSEAMVLSIPSTISKNDLPASLEKVEMIFEIEDGTPYKLETRVVRYQQGKKNTDEMVLVPSDKVSPLQKREQERAELNLPCKFHSVKVTVEGSGKKEKVTYVPNEKAHEGILEDISTGGCRLIATLPIKADQHIYIDGPFNAKQNDQAVGTIVRTTKRSDGIFILHIRFLKIDMKVVNRIQAMVCKYDV